MCLCSPASLPLQGAMLALTLCLSALAEHPARPTPGLLQREIPVAVMGEKCSAIPCSLVVLTGGMGNPVWVCRSPPRNFHVHMSRHSLRKHDQTVRDERAWLLQLPECS